MKKKNIYQVRLRKLAMHLKKEELQSAVYQPVYEPEIIDHNYYYEDIEYYFVQPILESVCVFPNDWIMSDDGLIHWKKDVSKSAYKSAMKYYGLTESMFCHLFVPRHQHPLMFGGKSLGIMCTPAQIGDNMLDLLELLRIQTN